LFSPASTVLRSLLVSHWVVKLAQDFSGIVRYQDSLFIQR